MKSRKKIRRAFQPFRYVECDEFAKYLHGMSLKGWHFKAWSAGLSLEKGEPADITYDVEVFPKGTEMDTRPEDDAQEYAEYCQAAGWQFIDGQRKFCIFRKMEDDAPPIVTEEEKLKNIRKAEGRVLLSNVLFLVFFTALQYAQLFTQVERFFVNIWIFILAVVSLITVVRIAQLIYLNIWYVSMKRRIRQGRPIRFYGRKGRWLYGALTLLLFAGGVIFFGMEKNKMGIFIFIIGIALVMLLYTRDIGDTSVQGQQLGGADLRQFRCCLCNHYCCGCLDFRHPGNFAGRTDSCGGRASPPADRLPEDGGRDLICGV